MLSRYFKHKPESSQLLFYQQIDILLIKRYKNDVFVYVIKVEE